ncbi:MAG: response regulator [Clostridia bacterium]|nr:response regulator [Clostridia bacterium]
MLCVICDDLAAERTRLINLLCRFGENHSVKMQTVQFDCAEALLESYEIIKNADMIFMDIYMAETDGMTAAKQIYAKGYEGSIVFCTTSSDFAAESYSVDADGYLVKPYDINAFDHVMQRVKHRWEKEIKTISFSSERLNYDVRLDDIIFIETYKKGCIVYTKFKHLETTKTIGEFYQELIGEENFYKLSRSFIINFRHLKNYDDDNIYMNCNHILPMPVRTRQAVKSDITNWRWRQMEEK